jgi:alpha-mannosidase/mannosylglycerate hydrolase
VPYQLLQVIPQTKETIIDQYKMPRMELRQGVKLALDTTMVPAQAQHFILRRAEGPTRIPFEPAIGVAANRLRNAHLEIVAESDGTISLTDLASGCVYRNLLQLEDTADIGDGWFHGDALQECSYLSTGGKVAFGLTENGPLLARLHLRIEWEVPEEFLFDRNVRSKRLTPLVAEHVVTLRKGCRYAEIQTTLCNTARDHRVRLLCPTGLDQAQTYTADSPFDAVKRPIALHPERHLWKELQVDTTPQQNWVAVSQEKGGLALLAPGQYESAVLDQPGRPICLTLLRAFRRAVFTDGNEGGQIPGPHRKREAGARNRHRGRCGVLGFVFGCGRSASLSFL